MPTWLAIGLGLWVFFVVAVVALCRAAARGARPDREDLGYPDPYGISERMRRRARALEREGVIELQGHHRIGIDHVKRGAAVREHPAP